jgi:hypothetical protein
MVWFKRSAFVGPNNPPTLARLQPSHFLKHNVVKYSKYFASTTQQEYKQVLFYRNTTQPTKDAQTDGLLAAPSLGFRNLLNQLLDNGWVCERAQVSKLVRLASDKFPQNTAHDLARARLGQVTYKVDLPRRCEGADDFANLEGELLLELGLGVILVFTGEEFVSR